MAILRQTLLALVGANRRFHLMDTRERVIASHRPFFVSVVVVCLIAVVNMPTIFTNGFFLFGLVTTVVGTIAGLIVPWTRFSSPVYWAIPLTEFVAVGALRVGGGEFLTGVSLIAVFPVFWLAWSNVAPVAAHIVNFTATLLIVWSPLFIDPAPLRLTDLTAPFLVPVIMLIIGVFASNVSHSIQTQQRELRDKDRELREAAERSYRHSQLLDTVLSTVHVGVVVVDEHGNDVLMNAEQRRTHQRGIPADVPDPTEAQLILFGADRRSPIPADQRPVRRAINGASFTNQLIWIGAGENQRALSVAANPMADDEGHLSGSVIVFNDVTNFVNALEAKDGFLQSVSHELRTPLTSILGYLDIALEEVEATGSDSPLIAPLQVAQRNAERLMHLVSDLLETASAPSISLQPTCLAEVIRSSLMSAQPRAATAGVTLIDETPETLPAMIDPERIHQVLDNLISNAIKYSTTGGTVTAKAWAETGSVFCQIVDTGSGMTVKEQAEIFDKFFRTDRVRTAGIPGVGLGLPISKSLVEAHRGSIMVESTPGRGTTFTLTLPLPSH